MKVAVIGAGYVGLVQAAGLANLGHRVALAEANAGRVVQLERGEVPIFEQGLKDLFDRAREHDLLTFHTKNVEAVADAEIVFLTLPTPPGGDGNADLSIVHAVVEELAPHLRDDMVVVTKSTVPVGTAADLHRRLRDLGCNAGVVSNPEFLREGSAVDDFTHAERVVIGAFNPADGRRVAELYRGLSAEVVITDPASAELTKYAANAYLATRLTFVNSLANIAEEVGADILSVVRGMGLDRRIGNLFLRPGPGFGGSCFPKDTLAMVGMTEAVGYDFKLLRAVIEVDGDQRRRIVERVVGLLGGVENPRVALWGLAFKAETDDTRESPAIKIGMGLMERGIRVVAHDPEAAADGFEAAPDPVAAADGADLVIVATEWPAFIRADLGAVAKAMRGDVVYDVRNLLDADAVRAAGLRYIGLGRPNV